MPRFAKCVVAVLVIVQAAPALAQGSNPNKGLLPGAAIGIFDGTPQEQAACAADVHKYCRDEIPDTFMVLGCLKTERKKISKQCQQVLRNHGQ